MILRAGNGRAAFGLATAAVGWAAAVLVWALVAPVYSSGQTLLEVNPELAVRIAIAIPIAVASVVWLLLHVACRSNAAWARTAARTVAWLLLAFALLAGFSVGLFALPAAVALVAAAALTPVARDRVP